MKTTKALFFELMHDFQSERWNEFFLLAVGDDLRGSMALLRVQHSAYRKPNNRDAHSAKKLREYFSFV